MNKLKKIFVTIIFIPLISCNLTDVTDVDPVYQVPDDKVITNIEQAQTALYGAYGILNDGLEIIVYTPGVASLMGLTMKPGNSASGELNAFYNNDVTSDNFYLENIYSKMYFLINNVNHIISKTKELETDDPRKKEIISEAKFLRAYGHFQLLRLWGEFYDENSPYGIVIKSKPINDAEVKPRASVAEVYGFILEDLDYAVKNGPDFSNSFYTSTLAAKALKSKVLLYKKDYKIAAQLSEEVIVSNERQLEDNFANIFEKKIEAPLEVIFQVPFDDQNDRNNKEYMFFSNFTVSDYYIDFMKGDQREDDVIAYTDNGEARNKKFMDASFNGSPLTADTQYFLRLDEIYLIYAEAVLRGENDASKSLKALNTIRERSENNPIVTSDNVKILEDIRKEKIYELGAENGEEWFDLIRYNQEGDININNFKDIPSETRLILPIPSQSVQLSDGEIEQNPGY